MREKMYIAAVMSHRVNMEAVGLTGEQVPVISMALLGTQLQQRISLQLPGPTHLRGLPVEEELGRDPLTLS